MPQGSTIGPGPVQPVQPQTGMVTLLFTDIVSSVPLKQRLGDKAGAALIQQQRALVRHLLTTCPGAEEIETAGDSFLLSFTKPSDAVRFALVLQSRLRGMSPGQTTPLQERIGIHLGEVVIEQHQAGPKPKDLYGLQIDTCARVMALAQGGQVLMSREVFDNARQVLKGEDIEGIGPLEWLNHGRYVLKGLEEAVEVCEVREAGQALAPGPPATSKNAQRQVQPEEEPVLGWRPGVGQVVPNTRWVLEKKLGEGGFGEVWLGRQQTTKEHRVFKFCFQAEHVRFLKRELTLFRLLKERIGDHPNIVRLHDVFLDQAPYFVEMDYVEGTDLWSWCEGHGGPDVLALETRLEIVAQAADALQAAHEAGIIHRDIKPANILIGGKGTGATEIRVKLTDFGIGQVVSEDFLQGITRAGFTQTMSGEASSSKTGTYLYMAPELLGGKPASTRSDLYSLGVVLYQLLVGDLARPLTTDWGKDIEDGLLREDLQHCFAGDPQGRFAGAGQLAVHLRTWEQRKREAIREQAEQIERERLRQQTERRHKLLLASGAIALALVALAVALGYGMHTAQVEREQQRRYAYTADMRAAQIAKDQGNLGQAMDLLRLHVPQPGEPDLRGIEWRYLWQAAQGHHIRVLDQEAMVVGLALGPGGTVVSVGLNGQTRIWDGPAGRMISDLPGPSVPILHQANAAAAGLNLLARLTTNGIEVERLPGLEAVVVLPEASWPMEFSHGGRWLATRGTNHQLTLWEAGVWEPHPIAKYSGNELSSLTLRFSPNNHDLLWCDRWSSKINVRELPPGQKERQMPGLEQMASLAVSPDGRWIAVGSWSGQVRILEYDTGTVVTNWSPHPGLAFGLAFSPDSQLLATGGNDQVVRLWNVGTWRLKATLSGNESEIWDIVFAADGQTLWTAGKDGTVRQFPVRAPSSLEPPLILPTNSTIRVISPRGDRALVAKETDTFAISELDTVTLASKPLVSVPKSEVFGVKHWPHCLSIALTNGEVILVCTEEAPAVARFQLPSPTARLLARSPDGRAYLLQDLKGTQRAGPIFTWDSNTGRTEIELGVAPACARAAYSHDGRYVVTQSYPSSEAVVWDLPGRRQRSVLRGHLWYVYCVTFSPDGRWVATGSWDATARIWDAATGQVVSVLKGHRSGVNRVQFSADGRTLFTGGDDRAVRFWNVATGREMLCVDGICQDLVNETEVVPRLSSDDRALLFGPFVSEPGESGTPDPLWRYRVTTIPTLAEIDSAP